MTRDHEHPHPDTKQDRNLDAEPGPSQPADIMGGPDDPSTGEDVMGGASQPPAGTDVMAPGGGNKTAPAPHPAPPTDSEPRDC